MLEPGTQSSMEQVEVWRREMTWGEPGQIEGYKKWDFEQERSRRGQGKRRKGYASYANMRLFSLFFPSVENPLAFGKTQGLATNQAWLVCEPSNDGRVGCHRSTLAGNGRFAGNFV
jgi:hypothetical protein